MKRVVWIISEGSPGHISQSEGLVAALARRIDLESTIIETRPKLNGFARTLCRFWMGRRGRALSGKFLSRWLDCEIPAAAPRPDLIVASGGKAVFAARSIAVKFSAPLVFIGERKRYPSEWFHTVFTPSAVDTGVSDVSIELIPTRVTHERVEQAAAAWTERPDGRLWAMVIGGASVSHRYSMQDWDALASSMNALANREGIRWLVTTSPRTGAEVEARLREKLTAGSVAEAVWWAEKPERKMAAFLGTAERVIVTQDSITMITEAVASGRPVAVTRPADVRFPRDSFMPDYLANLEAAGRIIRISMADISAAATPAEYFHLRREPVEPEMIDYLLARLGRTKTFRVTENL
jgi:mitochondrial fission protein ELM1